MRVLIIDNYDSFTYNLYQCVGSILEKRSPSFELDVFRNNEITIPQIVKKRYDKIIISPGPGDPSDRSYFGVCGEVLTSLGKKIPILGVCLGMQGMVYYFGGEIEKAKTPMHGKTSLIKHDRRGIFKGLPQNLEVMRYHSLVAKKQTLPKKLKITALAEGEIMGLRHIEYPIEGVQFHPESFMTEGGRKILENFLFK